MSLTRVEDKTNRRSSSQLQMPVHLHRLSRVHSLVLRAVQNQERGGRTVRPVDRATLEEQLPIVPGPKPVVDEEHLVGDVARPNFGDLVANPHRHYSGCETVAVVGREPRCGVAPVRAARDADFFRVDETDIDEMVDAVNDVVELTATHVGVIQHAELDPSARARAIIGIEHRDASRGGDLSRPGV